MVHHVNTQTLSIVRGVEEVSLVFFNFIFYFCIMVYFPFLFFNLNMHCSA